MKNRIIILGMAAVTLANAAPLHVTVTEPSEINDLDRCVQKRFQDRASFGMGRMGPRKQPHRDVRSFSSENPAEQAVIDGLRAKGYEVIVYLAGRKIVETPPVSAASRRRYGVQGPALITNKSMASQPPSKTWLLAESRTALESFQTGDGYVLKRGAWTVAMRPLRATNSGCVSCHTSGIAAGSEGAKDKIAVGDPIGVAIYAYRQVGRAKAH
jgi:hypothetical protein